MPRFAITKYNPQNDSSRGRKSQRLSRETGTVVLAIESSAEGSGCPCGCGDEPKGKSTTFRMGHDQRLRGKLIRAHLTSTKVTLVIGDEDPVTKTAMEVAKKFGWEKYLKDGESRREGKNREVLTRALNSRRTIKVGRWEHTGQVVAVYGEDGDQEYEVEYVTKTGGVKRTRVPASEAVPA